MRRFFKLVSITMQQRMYYRAGFLMNLITPALLLVGQLLLWDSVYSQRGVEAMGGFTKRDMISYLLLAFMINNFLSWSSENALSREIRSGTVIQRRMRPVPFIFQTFAEMVGNIALQGALNVVLVSAIFIIFRRSLVLPSVQALPIFIVSLTLAMALRMALIAWFSLLCFFTTGHLGLTWTRTALTEFFSGALIPVSMFPGWLQTFSYFTPFPLMLQVPVAIFTGQQLPVTVIQSIGLQLMWLIVFLLMHRLIYGYVSKNATLAGG